MEEITIEKALTILGNVTEHPGLTLSKAEHIVVSKALEVIKEFVDSHSMEKEMDKEIEKELTVKNEKATN